MPMVVRLQGDGTVFDEYRAATAAELQRLAGAVPGSDIALARADNQYLLLAWAGGECDVGAALSISPTSMVLTEDPRRGCDAVGITKGIVLHPASPLDPSRLRLMFVRATLLP
jgi:hypothetical protein